MKKTISINGKDFVQLEKNGLIDMKKNVVMSNKYDRLEGIDENLFAAIKERRGSGIPTNVGVLYKGNLDYDGLICCWNNVLLKKNIAQFNIDFYSEKGKLKIDKKVLAYYYSKMNKLLIFMDETYKWNLATIDYEYQEINLFFNFENFGINFNTNDVTVSEYDENIDRVRETLDGKLIIEKKGIFEIIFDEAFIRRGPFNLKDIETTEKGFIGVLDNNKRGFFNYNGKVVLECEWDNIIPHNNFLEVFKEGASSAKYSYSGNIIVSQELMY